MVRRDYPIKARYGPFRGESSMVASWWDILTKLNLFAWGAIMIIGIVLIEALVVVARMWVKHRERMAMIEKGMNPGSVDETYKKDKV
jgi:hypothetical protein